MINYGIAAIMARKAGMAWDQEFIPKENFLELVRMRKVVRTPSSHGGIIHELLIANSLSEVLAPGAPPTSVAFHTMDTMNGYKHKPCI